MKKLIYLLLTLLLLNNIFALQVVDTTGQPQNQQQQQSQVSNFKQIMSEIPWSLIGTITLITLGIVITGGLIFWFFYWLYNKINEDKRTKDNTEYVKYQSDLKMCKINADGRYIKRLWWSFYLLRKRAVIYAQTSEGLRNIGYYLGEAVKKDGIGYFIMGIEQRHSFFSRETDVIIMPYEFKKDLYRKNDDFSVTLVCEGIDETMSSEYYSMPVILNPVDKTNKQRKFIDFSNMIIEDYFKEYIYRDVIKEQTKEFKDRIKEATEMNASIQIDRKTQGTLKD